MAKAVTPVEFTRTLQGVLQRHAEVKALALRRVAEHVRDEAQALIGTEDESWPALADSTVEEKQRLGYTGRVSATDPLLRTGELRASIQVGEVTPERSVVGTDDPIAAFQEHGTSRIPPRPFIGTAVFREHDKILAVIGETLTAGLKGRHDG